MVIVKLTVILDLLPYELHLFQTWINFIYMHTLLKRHNNYIWGFEIEIY